ncbi:hypothetical protein FIBSPDRAFT_355483 [Athelia psychrophila]|uniref:Uncharacterized protein n=1 Tax=Athelia psychrophila TaxID=1759441 RepID=A0A167VU00_9AGAM|nr:hypothetical protein FIBSPDRAFT_355483 [Fibularhizoctonia sp. CBS 109695]
MLSGSTSRLGERTMLPAPPLMIFIVVTSQCAVVAAGYRPVFCAWVAMGGVCVSSVLQAGAEMTGVYIDDVRHVGISKGGGVAVQRRVHKRPICQWGHMQQPHLILDIGLQVRGGVIRV